MTRYFEIIGKGNDPFVTACISIDDKEHSFLYLLKEHEGCVLGEISENTFNEYGDKTWLIPRSTRRFKIQVIYKLVNA